MKIIYYSRGSVIPALLAAVKHQNPATTREQVLQQAFGWWSEQNLEEQNVLLLSLGKSTEGVDLYVMSSPIPPSLVERTLANLAGLIRDDREAGDLTLVSALPFSRSGEKGADTRSPATWQKLSAMWPEIEAAVNQAQLQISLKEKLS